MYIKSLELVHFITGSLYPNISPFPSLTLQPLASTILLATSLTFTFYVPHINEITQYWSFCVSLTWLSIMSFRTFVHVNANGIVSFFVRLNNILWYDYTHTHTHTHIRHFLYPFIHWQDTLVVSLSWLVWIILHWTWEYTYLLSISIQYRFLNIYSEVE